MAIFKAATNQSGKAVGHAVPRKLEDYLKYNLDERGRPLKDSPRTQFVSALNGDADDFSLWCRGISAQFGTCQKYDDLKYKHYIQGFAPEDNARIDEETCHRLGVELARTLWKDFPVLVVSHFDQESEDGSYHWHNHFLVYNTAVTDGHRLNTSGQTMWAQKRFVAAQAESYGLTRRGLVLEDGKLRESRMPERITLSEHHMTQRGQAALNRENMRKDPREVRQRTFLTQKAELRLAVRVAVAKCDTLEQIKEYLQRVYGVETKESRGELSFLHPERAGEARSWIRGRTLGNDFTKEALSNVDEQRNRRSHLAGRLSEHEEHSPGGESDDIRIQRLYEELFRDREDPAIDVETDVTVAEAERRLKTDGSRTESADSGSIRRPGELL